MLSFSKSGRDGEARAGSKRRVVLAALGAVMLAAGAGLAYVSLRSRTTSPASGVQANHAGGNANTATHSPPRLTPFQPVAASVADQAFSEVFPNGVASGDPDSDGFVIWTRYSPTLNGDGEPVPVTVAEDANQANRTTVAWSVAEDVDMSVVVASGEFETHAGRDHTVKVEVTGLEAGRYYYYQFGVDVGGGAVSRVGRSKTLPVGDVDSVRLAAVTCSIQNNVYSGYRALVEMDDIDAVLHLGDYWYETSIREPRRETVTLFDYRENHLAITLDDDLQDLRATYPLITIWDDHEMPTNDGWDDDEDGPRGGAQNHNEATECPFPDDCSWEARKLVASQSYFEWMPIRESTTLDSSLEDDVKFRRPRIWRSFQFGDLAKLVMMDARIGGREEQSADPVTQNDPDRKMISELQMDFMKQEMAGTDTLWKVVGQQVMMAHDNYFPEIKANGETVAPATVKFLDMWGGYAAQRQELFEAFGDDPRVVVLTGDYHNAFASELVDHNQPPEYPALAKRRGVEHVTPGLTSRFPQPDEFIFPFTLANPSTKFQEFNRNGFVVLQITKTEQKGLYYTVNSISDPNDKSFCLYTALSSTVDAPGILNFQEPPVDEGYLNMVPTCTDRNYYFSSGGGLSGLDYSYVARHRDSLPMPSVEQYLTEEQKNIKYWELYNDKDEL